MLALSLYFLVVQAPLYAWLASVSAICSTRGRIAVGGRVKKTLFFYLHLVCSIPGFVLLSYLTFVAVSSWMFTLVSVLYVLAFVMGIPSWFLGVKKIVRSA